MYLPVASNKKHKKSIIEILIILRTPKYCEHISYNILGKKKLIRQNAIHLIFLGYIWNLGLYYSLFPLNNKKSTWIFEGIYKIGIELDATSTLKITGSLRGKG